MFPSCSTSSPTRLSEDNATIPICCWHGLGCHSLQKKWDPILSPTEKEDVYYSPTIQDIFKSWVVQKERTGRIPRPPNCFLIFRAATGLNSRTWNALTPEQKKPWQDISQWCKNEHQRQFHGYKFRPRYKLATRGSKEVKTTKKPTTITIPQLPNLNMEGPSTSVPQAPPQQFGTTQGLPTTAGRLTSSTYDDLQLIGLPSTLTRLPLSPLTHAGPSTAITSPSSSFGFTDQEMLDILSWVESRKPAALRGTHRTIEVPQSEGSLASTLQPPTATAQYSLQPPQTNSWENIWGL